MAQCDLRTPQEYVSWRVEESRMAFRLQTRMLECRANMPTKFRRDLVSWAGRKRGESVAFRSMSRVWRVMAGAGPPDAQIKSGIFYEVKIQATQVTSEESKVAP